MMMNTATTIVATAFNIRNDDFARAFNTNQWDNVEPA